MLEYLHTFCNFFVYSHGLKSYVHEILKKLDPENKYFKDREKTFLAPIDAKMQNEMNQNRKSMTDFKLQNSLLSQSLSGSSCSRAVVEQW